MAFSFSPCWSSAAAAADKNNHRNVLQLRGDPGVITLLMIGSSLWPGGLGVISAECHYACVGVQQGCVLGSE